MFISNNLRRVLSLLVIFCTFAVSGLLSKPAEAGIFASGISFRRSCEALLVDIYDRKNFVQAKSYKSLELEESKSRLQKGINSWIEYSSDFAYVNDNDPSEHKWAKNRILTGLERWTELIRDNLTKQGLLAAEINKGQLEWSFLLNREALLRLYPEFTKFDLPSDYELAVTPALWLMPSEAATDSENKLILLPKSILWGLSAEDQISVLHESLHARLESMRKNGSLRLFPFVFKFSGELQEKIEPFLGDYASNIFSPEEIAVRAVTLAYRTERLCSGEIEAEAATGFSDDILGLYVLSGTYLRDILPELLQRDLGSQSTPEFTKEDAFYSLKTKLPGFHVYLEPAAWDQYFAQDQKRGLRDIRQVLLDERSWVNQARNSLSFAHGASMGASGKKAYDWKALCRQKNQIWKLANDLGLDLSALRSK